MSDIWSSSTALDFDITDMQIGVSNSFGTQVYYSYHCLSGIATGDALDDSELQWILI